MEYLDAIILGIIEGITEFLPISSTAHLILGSKLLDLGQTEFVKSFEIIIQLGAILAVVTLYFKLFLKLDVIYKVVVGFLPTALFGLLAYKTIKVYLGNINIVLWSLFIGGILIIIFELFQQKKVKQSENIASVSDLTLSQCISVGLFQCIAFIPGVSRSAATIIGGMSIGMNRMLIAEYSFLIAVPTMLAASSLDIIKNREVILSSNNLGILAIGFIVSYIVAIIAIKFLISYLKKNSFITFGVYRIIVSILFWLFVI